ncbi:MAG: glutathione S-transferase family protein [Lentisphaeraceae bacterium]|nr:glutathione S-transferase family protein [Lentisphaeraceae bacterium]
MITLYGLGLSLYVRKVRIILEWKGLGYAFDPVIPGRLPEDLKVMTPLGKIPFMKDGDFHVSDSSVISMYLDKKYPQSSVFPESAESLAKALWYEEYSDTKVTEVISGIFFERVGKPALMGMEADEEVIKEKEAQIPELFAYLEESLQGKEFLVDGRLTIADISLITNLVNYVALGYEFDEVLYPLLTAYTARMMAEPAVMAVMIKEKAETQSMKKTA